MNDEELIEEAAKLLRQGDRRVDVSLRGTLAGLLDEVSSHAESCYPCCDNGIRQCYEFGAAAMSFVDAVVLPHLVESRPEPEPRAIQIPLPDDDHWIHRVELGGGYHMAAFRKFDVMVIGFAPANGYGKSLPAHLPVGDIYRHIRSGKPDIASADLCFTAIGLLKSAIGNEEKK